MYTSLLEYSFSRCGCQGLCSAFPHERITRTCLSTERLRGLFPSLSGALGFSCKHGPIPAVHRVASSPESLGVATRSLANAARRHARETPARGNGPSRGYNGRILRCRRKRTRSIRQAHTVLLDHHRICGAEAPTVRPGEEAPRPSPTCTRPHAGAAGTSARGCPRGSHAPSARKRSGVLTPTHTASSQCVLGSSRVV
jgi:hypothetical protein